MSTTVQTPEELAAAARAALEKTVETRVAAVSTLAARSADAEAAEKRAVDAQNAFAAAWTSALASGWTDKELRQLGLTAPGEARPRLKRPVARKRRDAEAPSADATAEE